MIAVCYRSKPDGHFWSRNAPANLVKEDGDGRRVEDPRGVELTRRRRKDELGVGEESIVVLGMEMECAFHEVSGDKDVVLEERDDVARCEDHASVKCIGQTERCT